MRREHLSAAANLTFALASAGVGFCASLIPGKDHPIWTSPGNYFFISAIILFIVAVVLSMCLMWTRLQDFRLTAERLHLELRSSRKDTINSVARKADCFGMLTWGLYRSQLVTSCIRLFAVNVCFPILGSVRMDNKRLSCGPIRPVNHYSEWPARARQIRGISPPE